MFKYVAKVVSVVVLGAALLWLPAMSVTAATVSSNDAASVVAGVKTFVDPLPDPTSENDRYVNHELQSIEGYLGRMDQELNKIQQSEDLNSFLDFMFVLVVVALAMAVLRRPGQAPTPAGDKTPSSEKETSTTASGDKTD